MDGWSGVEAWNWEETQGPAKQHTCGFARQRGVLGDAPRWIPQPASSADSMVRPDREGGGGWFGGLGCWSVCPPFASDQLREVGVPSVKRTSSPILAKEHQPRGGVCVGRVWLVARVGAAPRSPGPGSQAWRYHLFSARSSQHQHTNGHPILLPRRCTGMGFLSPGPACYCWHNHRFHQTKYMCLHLLP